MYARHLVALRHKTDRQGDIKGVVGMDKCKRDMTDEERKMLEAYLYEICKEVYLLSETYEVHIKIIKNRGSDHARGTYRDNMSDIPVQTVNFIEGDEQ